MFLYLHLGLPGGAAFIFSWALIIPAILLYSRLRRSYILACVPSSRLRRSYSLAIL